MKDARRHFELVWELAWRDIRLQYRRPYFGFLWMLIIPASLALMYKFLLSDLMHVRTGAYPFFIYLLCAMIPWNFFANSLQRCSRCILDNRNIIHQLAFPKALIPVSTVVSNLIQLLPALAVLVLFQLLSGAGISPLAVLLPFVLLLHVFMVTGIAFFVSALQVFHRDTEYFLQVVLAGLFFLTPVVYPLDLIVSSGHPLLIRLYFYNPLVGLTDLYRAALLPGFPAGLPAQAGIVSTLIVPCVFSVFVLLAGFRFFRTSERLFYDHLNR
ncbi:MAG: ABC transporter permease [Deltaproteobacteria bacterium]